MIRMQVRLNTSGLDAYIRSVQGAPQRVADGTALHGQQYARGLMHVVTGSGRASTYAVTSSGSDYAVSVALARRLNPRVVILPERRQAVGRTPGRATAAVGVAALPRGGAVEIEVEVALLD